MAYEMFYKIIWHSIQQSIVKITDIKVLNDFNFKGFRIKPKRCVS